MPSQSNRNNLDEFIRDLENTSEQVEKLLETVRASEMNFVEVKYEIRILCETVKDISNVLRDTEGGFLTRVLLLEQKIKELQKDFDKEETRNREISAADKTGSWHLKAAMATGILGFFTSVATLLVHFIK